MAAEEVGWGDDEDDAASPTAAGLQPAAPGPALAPTASAATAAASALMSPAKTSVAAVSPPALDQASAISQPEPVLRTADEHPAADPDEVATSSDSTDGAGAGERWTVVSSGTPTKTSAAALPAARLPDSAAATEGDAGVPAASPKATSVEGSATATVDAAGKSPAKPAAPLAPAPPKPVAEDSDDDLGDVDVPDDGVSDVDEDWGDISE